MKYLNMLRTAGLRMRSRAWLPGLALAALAGFRPQVVCRSSDYRFMSALVGAGVGVDSLGGGRAMAGFDFAPGGCDFDELISADGTEIEQKQ